ncbi:hypothetical protein Ahy_A05g022985 [Arachis hypogaea]|uniref:non-specific serine/threonine protein kinase n=1 Tax=Arachis hypogaea TaxID=3818 RepID=A0A445D242_ARAHY|nr:hypothetical protein Ahy_A05g022985 [Arachis hypogaea]
MDNHIDIHMHIPVRRMIFLLLLINSLTPSLSQQPLSNRYFLCKKQLYNCGTISNISYPFWGVDRPRYCGGGDQFNLTCELGTGQFASIQIASQKFQVIHIDGVQNKMRMIPMPPIVKHEFCSMKRDFNLSSPSFWYSETVQNITIFYDCPAGFSNFTCPSSSNHRNKKNNNVVFYEGVEEQVLKEHPELKECGRSLRVATDEGALHPNVTVDNQIIEALNWGFHMNYSFPEECKRCMRSEGVCGSNNSSPDGSNAALSCYLPRRTSNRWQWKLRHIIVGFIAIVIPGLVLIYICTVCCLRYKSSSWEEVFWFTTKSNQDIEAILKSHGALSLKRYKFCDVKKMTSFFKVKLGQGGFGTVYKGKLLNGSDVAVKILNLSKGKDKEFINEVASISKTSHINIVTLFGFCLEGNKRALIYEFMSNGSLDTFIYKKGHYEGTPSLNWDQLYQIAIGIAKGLEYLHKECNIRIFHFDIKPHNILLDENFCPKISDFGLAKLSLRSDDSVISMSDARGTMGYVAPEMWNKHLGGISHRSDVYSYGMMLLEIVGGRKNIHAEANHTSEIYFPYWIHKRLEQGTQLGNNENIGIAENDIVKRMTIVGLWCIQTLPNDRPSISRVIDMLEGSMESLELPPKPILSAA